MPEKSINPKNATGFLLILIPAALAMSALFVAWPLILGVTILIAGGNVWQGYEWSKTARSLDPVFQQLIIQNRGEITPLDLSLNAQVSGAISNRYLAAKASEFGTGSRQHPDGGQIYYFVSISTLGRIFDDSDEAPMPTIMPATSPVVAFSPAFIHAESLVEVLQPELNPLANAASIPVVASIPPLETTPAATQSILPTQLESPSAPVAADSILSQNLDERVTPTIDLASSETDEPPTVAPSLVPTDSHLVTIIQSELAKRLDVHASTVYKRRSEPNFTDWTRNRDPEGLAWGYLEATKEYYRIDS
ncbi:hypothetical protein [Chamaesiphon sp.]|uniref:hypothetical protein n=1 Tax=Chamaesiphon sp. TaxID=2814140 RepID=UPI0035944D9D